MFKEVSVLSSVYAAVKGVLYCVGGRVQARQGRHRRFEIRQPARRARDPAALCEKVQKEVFIKVAQGVRKCLIQA